MNIIKDHVTNPTVRPYRALRQVRGLVVHYVGCNQTKATAMRKALQNSTQQASYHYVIDWNDGSIIQVIPENEVAFHVGANSYTATADRITGGSNPNNYLVGIECCIPSVENCKPSPVQRRELAAFCADFLGRYGFTTNDLYLHQDITGKWCHKWFCDHPEDWAAFKQEVKQKMEGEDDMTKQEVIEIIKEQAEKPYDTVAEVPDWGKATVEKLIRKKYLQGENGGLGLTNDLLRTLVINDRAGIYGD